MTAEAAAADEAAAGTAPPGGGEVVGVPSIGETLGGLVAAFGQGRTVAREAAHLGGELLRIALGRSDVAPAPGDRRFTDPAWSGNPLFSRIEQTYLAAAEAVGNLVDELGGDSDGGTGDARRAEQARFAAGILTSALAPTNFLATNPAALKRAFDTGGRSLVDGARNLVDDLRHNGGMPRTVERDAFEVGRDLALSPGAVVHRDPVAELLQYRPTTERVFTRPVLVVPPPIGRYYVLDLRPGRSVVEHLVGRGVQTFLVSWRNPTAQHGGWNLDTYAARVRAAIDSVREVTGCDDVNLIGFCAGGVITTTLLNHLAATGDGRVHSMSYAMALLDFGERTPVAGSRGANLLRFARARSRRSGVVTSRQTGAALTWMRPDDLVFHHWVNNYLMGQKPPASDVLVWNADGTNLPGALHCEFLDIIGGDLLTRPGGLTVLGTSMQLDRITVPTFVTAAVADDLTPWTACYRTTQLLGGGSTFVLSHSGRIASLVDPPGNPEAHHFTGGPPGPDPQRWLADATRQQGSWWESWIGWLTPRSGEERPAPHTVGSAAHPVLDPAPGRYVRDLPA